MYEEYYGFLQPPFTLAPDPRFLYQSESHGDAITQLLQAIRRREGFIVLAGDIGTGKTTVCRSLLQKLDPATFTALILNPFLSINELLSEALLDFGVVSREAGRSGRLTSASTHELTTTLHEFLLSLITIRGSAVLIIDEAQHLSPHILEQLRIISNLETDEAKLLQIVLIGQLNLLDVLAETPMRQLDQRISLRARLKPLTRGEVAAYIAHRISVANGTTPVTFEPEALDVVNAVTGGVPRIINLLCDRALMVGAELRVASLTPDIIRTAAARLDLKLPPSAVSPWRRRRTRLAIAGLVIVAATASVLLLGPIRRLVDAPLPAAPARPVPIVVQPISVPPVPTVTIARPPDL